MKRLGVVSADRQEGQKVARITAFVQWEHFISKWTPECCLFESSPSKKKYTRVDQITIGDIRTDNRIRESAKPTRATGAAAEVQ